MLAGRAADAINLFALDVYQHLQREEGNLFYSPLSVATALAMAYAGAAGQTAAEMEQVLHFGGEPGIHTSFAALLESIASHNEPFATTPKPNHTLTVANAIWPDDGLAVKPDFLDVMQNEYAGHVQAVDYGNAQQAQNTINNWVSSQTNGRISNLVDNLGSGIRMVLTNAAYFNGYWERQFDPRHTSTRIFRLENGEHVSVPMMYTETFTTPYTVIDGFKVLEMPFDGGANNSDYSMVFILPPENGANELTAEVFAKIDAWLDVPAPLGGGEVLVTLPKVNTAVSNNLNQLLSDLGMPTAFSLGAADFSNMTAEEVAISTVFHKANLTMNEQGTTAAAATRIDFYVCFAAGTPVLTPQGFKLIDELEAGDLVLARDEHQYDGDVLPKRVEKVHHRTAEILELRIGGQVIRTTDTHPFYVKEKGWTPAGELQPHDLLCTRTGDWLAVDAARLTGLTEPVFNLRVADYHTYFVGKPEWGFAAWVHNACGGEPEFTADRPFHMILRDNITSTIAFMGRVDDPRQTSNSVAPTVVAPNGDFDGNHVVDGADFLAWQRGFGKANPTLADGDGNQDGSVNAGDLNAWKQTFGQTASVIPAAATATAPPPETLAKSSATQQSAAPTTTLADLIDAAMALEWLAPDAGQEWSPLVEDPAQSLQNVAFDDSANEPVLARRASAAVEWLASERNDTQPADDTVFADDLLAAQLE